MEDGDLFPIRKLCTPAPTGKVFPVCAALRQPGHIVHPSILRHRGVRDVCVAYFVAIHPCVVEWQNDFSRTGGDCGLPGGRQKSPAVANTRRVSHLGTPSKVNRLRGGQSDRQRHILGHGTFFSAPLHIKLAGVLFVQPAPSVWRKSLRRWLNAATCTSVSSSLGFRLLARRRAPCAPQRCHRRAGAGQSSGGNKQHVFHRIAPLQHDRQAA